MGIKQLYNDNLRKLLNEYGEVSVMIAPPTEIFRQPVKSLINDTI